MSEDELARAALEARDKAYAPYSKFAVGAAILTKSGQVFTGCNVENRSLGLTICAERAAVAAAVTQGRKDFIMIAVATDSTEPAVPCGACRQVLAEFNPSIKVITSTVSGQREVFTLTDLLPRAKQGMLEEFDNV